MGWRDKKKNDAVLPRILWAIYGPPGVGKTNLTLEFPVPLVITTDQIGEDTIPQYQKKAEERGGTIQRVNCTEEIKDLAADIIRNKNDQPTTIVLDNFTKQYMTCAEEKKKKTTNPQRAYGLAQEEMEKILRDLINGTRAHIILTGQEKNIEEKGEVIGVRFNCWPGFLHDISLILHMPLQDLTKKTRVAVVSKSWREEFKPGEAFNISYEELKRRFALGGIDIESTPSLPKIDAMQLSEIKTLMAVSDADETKFKEFIFERFKVSEIEKLNMTDAADVIKILRAKAAATEQKRNEASE